MAEMLRLVTGWDVDADELRTTAGRIVTAKKWYNIQTGWTPDEDRLPDRFYRDALPDSTGGDAILSRERMQTLIQQYNLARGWTVEGYLPDPSGAESSL